MALVWGAIVCGRSVLDAAGFVSIPSNSLVYFRKYDIPMRVVS